MSNIKFVVALVLIGFISVAHSQIQESNRVYRSYTTEAIPYHLLIVENNELIVEIPKRGAVTFGSSVLFNTRTEKDTIFIMSKLTGNVEKEGIVISNSFTTHFLNTKLYQKSNTELVLLDKNRPYFKKQLVDSLIGDNAIYYINGDLFKVPLSPDSNANQIDIYKLLKKPKRAKIKKLDGKKAYEKYGIIGLNGVIEIFDRKRRCR